jgi:tetratricopeptide (TPR) repeat protein
MFAPTIVGRSAEMDLISTLLSDAESGSGTTALLSGPGGIGKTSLLQWLDGIALAKKFWVRRGYCLPGIQDPFFAMEQLLRPGNEEPLPKARTRTTQDSGGLPLTLKPGLSSVPTSGQLPMALVPFGREPAKGSSPAKGAPASVLLGYLSRIESEARLHPCVLLLDDFQWADPDTAQALRFLIRNIKRMPVLIVVALREDEIRSVQLREVVRDLRHEGLINDIPLTGLKEADIHHLLENTVESPLDDRRAAAAVRFLTEMTGGNPYFFLEVVRLWQEIGLIRIEGGKAVIDVPLAGRTGRATVAVPESVSNLLARKLGFLNGEEMEVLEAAAMLGQEFEVAPLEDLFHSHTEEVGRALKKLSGKREIVVPKDEKGLRYAFAHTLLWENIRTSTSQEKLRPWAAKLASWWVAHFPADLDQIAAFYELGGLNSEAGEYIDRAIDLSLQMHAHERVARYFEKGVELMEREATPVAEVAEWGLLIVDRMRGDGAGQKLIERMVRELLKKDPPAPLSWELSVRLASTVERSKEERELMDRLFEATRERSELASPALLGRIALANSVLLYSEGKADAAAESARVALAKLPKEERFYRGFAYFRLGWIHVGANRLEEATKDLENGQAIAKEGRLWGLLPLLLNLQGTIAVAKGDLKATEECMTDAVSTYINLGQAGALSITLSNLSNTRLEMGDLDGAEEAARDAMRVAEAFGQQMSQGVAACSLGRVLEHRKAPREAIELFEKASRIYKETGSNDMLRQLEFDLAEAKGLSGYPLGALDDLSKIKEGDALIQDQLPYLHLLRARFSAWTGDEEEARAEIERAMKESRRMGLRYWQGRSYLALSEWESAYGSPEKAKRARNEAEETLGECGVLDVEPFVEGMRPPDSKS